jgi:hypothetical protein
VDRRAAEQRNVIAQRQLTILHAHGSGVKQDFSESLATSKIASKIIAAVRALECWFADRLRHFTSPEDGGL